MNARLNTSFSEPRRLGRPPSRATGADGARQGLKVISQSVLSEALGRTPLDQYVIWTGAAACGRSNSVRARAMACVHEIGVPVSLRTLMQRAARLEGEMGLDPDVVRSAVRQHQFAQPAVVFLVRKTPSGDYVAVTDIPFAGDLKHRIKEGGAVMDRHGAMCLDMAPCAIGTRDLGSVHAGV